MSFTLWILLLLLLLLRSEAFQSGYLQANVNVKTFHLHHLSRSNEDEPLLVHFNDTKKSFSSKIFQTVKQLPGRIRRKTKDEPTQATQLPPPVVVRNVHQLRKAILEDKLALQDITFYSNFSYSPNNDTTVINATTVTTDQLNNHPVLQLLAERVQNSTARKDDNHHLALAIEGGGMRGAVSAGMATAIAILGLTDCFDSVYGSSAGSVVGAYMVSRQMCVDVYTQVLPAAKGRFASKRRVMGNLGLGLVNDMVLRLKDGSNYQRNNTVAKKDEDDNDNREEEETASSRKRSRLTSWASRISSTTLMSSVRPYLTLNPGMNISFVLDGVMSQEHGLRPFDMESFRKNNAKQPLYAVASTVRNGALETVAFSAAEGDYFDLVIKVNDTDMSDGVVVREGRIRRIYKATKSAVIKVVKLPVVIFRAVKARIRLRRNWKNKSKQEKTKEVEDETPPPIMKKPKITADKSPLFRRIKRKPIVLPPASNGTQVLPASACPDKSGKKGFFACLESSMLVPGAAGKPVRLLRCKHRSEALEHGVDRMVNTCFDAFCYEAIPYRSAVKNGATHVLVLRSRPDGCVLETVPGVYEKVVAPVYFRLNGLQKVVNFFESGGSQYRYLEDVLTLEEALSVGCIEGKSSNGVKVPPTEILYGTDQDVNMKVNTDEWKRAHMLPVILPAGTPELPTLTQDKDEVLLSVRNGFAAAFDMLAPIAGLDPSTVSSMKLAELIFPRSDDDDLYVLKNRVNIKGEYIDDTTKLEKGEEKAQRRFVDWMLRERVARRKAKWKALRNPFKAAAVEVEREMPDTKQYIKSESLDWLEAEALLAMLPGFRGGKLSHLAEGLRSVDDIRESTKNESLV